MATSVGEKGVETRGENFADLLHPEAQESLFERPELPIEVLLRRLIHPHHKKAVALAYYPARERRTGKPLSGPALEKHADQSVKNVDRMLEGHRPVTAKLVDCVMRTIPGAAVAVAHYYADRAGTERGALKVEALQLGERLAELTERIQREADDREETLRQLSALNDAVTYLRRNPR